MNTDYIHEQLYAQTADGGPSLPAPLHSSENTLEINVCTVDLHLSKDPWKALSLALLRGFKQVQGRTVARVRYHAIRNSETNPDGTCGTVQIDLAPVTSEQP